MEYIYEVYREKSFSKAAKNLFISQPSLSAAVKKVEVNLGYEIFDRSTKPIGLTEFGLEYIKSVEKILEIEDNFENYLNDLGDLKAGKVSIGGTSLFISHVLPFVISEFSKKYPKVELNIVEDNTVELENSLASGELDIVIDNYQFDPEIYDRQILMKDHIILVVPSSYKSNKNLYEYKLEYDSIISKEYFNDKFKPVKLDNFKDEPFIFLKEGNDTRIKADSICQSENFNPNIIFELDQQITSYNLSINGVGISFISDILIKSIGKTTEVCYYKLPKEFTSREIYFFYKHNRYLKQATREFLKMARADIQN